MEDTKSKVNKASLKQVIRVNELLKDNIEKVSDGWAKYNEGWNDQVIADIVGCSIHSVGRVRRDLYGNIRTQSEKKDDLEARVEKLENYIRSLDPDFLS